MVEPILEFRLAGTNQDIVDWLAAYRKTGDILDAEKISGVKVLVTVLHGGQA